MVLARLKLLRGRYDTDDRLHAFTGKLHVLSVQDVMASFGGFTV